MKYPNFPLHLQNNLPDFSALVVEILLFSRFPKFLLIQNIEENYIEYTLHPSQKNLLGSSDLSGDSDSSPQNF